ncbi:hypothetical protein ACLESO_38675 [Pyxidicoccus sp. 3LG]
MAMNTERRSRRARGQAMVEYAVITSALLFSTVVAWPYLGVLINALHRYYQSLYYVIQSPIP